MKEKNNSNIPEDSYYPEITPELLHTAFKALESKGALFFSENDGVYVPTESGWKLLMKSPPAKDVIEGYGHPGIKLDDLEKITITKESEPFDGSVIAVLADKSCKNIEESLKKALKTGKKVKITIECNGVSEEFYAFGSPALKLSCNNNVVIRKDDFIDDSTISIMSEKSAYDLNQSLAQHLRDPKNKIKIIIEV